jgi:16S rRNA (uracil1498-N3)-methyltransferase
LTADLSVAYHWDMHRVYVDRIDGSTVSLADAGQLHHLQDVLRLKPGDAVVVCDGAGLEYNGTITGLERKLAVIEVTSSMPGRRNKMDLTIACAIPKGDRLDDAIDQLTQLGVARLIPMVTERVVVKLDGAGKEARLKRWRKIAQNAARQSQQGLVPLVEPVTDFPGVISLSRGYDLKLIPHLEGERKPIKDVLASARPGNAIVLIGPEGDFSPAEVGLALRAGFIPVSLGGTVLRVATAAVAVAGYFKFSLEI